MKTRALITGMTGMVGSHLADFLLENTNWDIHGLQRWRSPLDNIMHLMDRINKKDRVFVHYGDLNDQSSLIHVLEEVKPDYIFHLAAQSYPLTSFTAPIDTLNTNILGTCRLLESVHLLNQNPIIHVCASSEVFGRVPKEKVPINEECSFQPASPYAISKVGTDLVGRYYAEAYDMTVMTTRMFTHTGPRRGDVFHESTFAKQIAMIEAGLREPVVKVGNLNSLRTYADVRDAVRAYYMLVTFNPIKGEYYNIGGTYTCTVGDTLKTLLSFSTEKNIKYVVDPERLRPIDADLQIPDCTKFTQHTGWKPEIPYEKTMLDLLNYWRDKIKTSGSYIDR
ncbi:GDP-mannose 4,6-dehydratase [Caproicibacter fermentans]|uniref:GDP-mannose 4,6-dehydratase n=1 Tax=Caproicibacter fermentans TaxID=2576756 RepID=A0A7G8TFN6_9FIRM|nr:GDP-mannose 4,6-dehydratase [Caproicibacter fermentans]QNK42427.1 GDP-mannose 4,6-dehydratase [Caproicibacter fermentans]